MKKKFNILFATNTAPVICAFALFVVLFLSAVPAGAAVKDAILGGESETSKLLTKLSSNVSTIKSPGQITAEVLQVVLGFLGLVGVIMIIYAGFLWLTAGGEEDKAKRGSTLLFQAIIGTFIVLAAYTITVFVLKELTKAVTGA